MPSVSDVKIWPVKTNKVILANGNFLVDKVMQIKFTIINGPKGPFVGFPGKSVEKDGKRTFYPDVSVIDDAFKTELTKSVMKAYNEKTGNKSSQGDSPEPASQVMDDEVPF